jgi:hypothetical protein
MIASASTGCNVAMEPTDNNTPAMTPTAATAVLAAANAAEDVRIAVVAAVPGTAVNCTVSLSWNGITVATKSFTFIGVAASITVADVTVGVKSGQGYYRVTVRDANGNLVPGAVISNSATEANNAASAGTVSDSSSNSVTTSSTVGSGYGRSPAITQTTIGDGTVAAYTCTTKGGAAKVTVRALASGVTYATSAPFDVMCGASSVATWSVSLDKASYAPGEIATLTVSAKDSSGDIAQSLLALGASASAFGGMTFVTAPTDTDTFNSAAGAKTYQLSVGTTEGAFVGTFKITGSTDTAAKTVQYKITAPSTGAVSNADVLKAIVSLIASINKQIAALQKALLKK